MTENTYIGLFLSLSAVIGFFYTTNDSLTTSLTVKSLIGTKYNSFYK